MQTINQIFRRIFEMNKASPFSVPMLDGTGVALGR
jgi:hypothetical protein